MSRLKEKIRKVVESGKKSRGKTPRKPARTVQSNTS